MNELIPELWAAQMGYESERLLELRKETIWLRQSLEAELAPDWLIELVVAKWRKWRMAEWTRASFYATRR